MARNRLNTALLAAACLSIVALVGWSAGAESAEIRVVAQPAAVAVVNVEQALNELKEFNELLDDLKTRVESRQAELNQLRTQAEEIKAKLDQLPPTETTQRLELVVRGAEIEEMRKAKLAIYQRLIQVERGEIIQPLYNKFYAAVEEIAKKNGYDLVLYDDRNVEVLPGVEGEVSANIQRKRILYAADRLDITDQVVLLMDQKYQAGVN